MSELSIGTEIRRRRLRWFAIGMASATAVFVLDAITADRVVTLITLLAVPPFVAAVGASRTQTFVVAAYSIALTVPAGLIDGIFGDFEHVLKTVVVGLVALAAVRVASVRDRAELGNALDHAVSHALATSSTLADATPRLLGAIGDLLGWKVGSVWEAGGPGGTLACSAVWQAPDVEIDRFEELCRRLEFAPGVGLPGTVWKSGEPTWIVDVANDESLPRARAAASVGLHSAFAFPITGVRGTRGVIEFFTSSRRKPDSELLRMLSRLGRQVGQQLERRRAEEAVRQSEALRGAVLESALDCVITMNHEGRIVEFNRAAEQTFGYRRADVVGKLLGEHIVPPSLRKAHWAGLTRYLESGESRLLGQRLELTGMRADGSEFPVEITITRIGGQEPPMFAGYLRDLTEQKRAAQSVQRLAAIVEHSNDAVIAVKPGGEVMAWNPAAERLYGFTAEEAIGRPISFTVPPHYKDESAELVRRADRGEAVQNYQTQRLRRDGTLIDVALTLSPLRGADGALIGTAAIIRDITPQKREERRAAFISDAVHILDGSLDFEVVVRNLVRLVVPRLADWCAIHIPDPPDAIRMIAVRHSNPELERRAWELEERYPAHFDQPDGVPQVLRTGEPLLFSEIPDELLVEGTQDEDHLRLARELGLRSAMIVPLRARGETFGTITFVSAESDRLFDESDLAFASEFARRASLSIDNARLYADVEARRADLEFLARGSSELDSSLDLEETLQSVADLTVPYLADGCMVDLLTEHETIRRVASASALETVAPVLDRLREHHLDLESSHPIATALRTGRIQIVEQVTEELRREWSPDESYLEDIRSWPARAAVVVPMRARGRTLGTIALASFTDRKFTPRTVATIEELARRASVAVDNARLYGERSYIAARLQQSLLPPHLPDVPGLEIAARFRPAGDAYDVGGDFYDIFETGSGSWAIAMGDVCGKGADAAALTAMARYTLRATAIRAAQRPERVLSLLNQVLLTEAPREQFLTVAYANLRVGDQSTELSMANAGHPLPLLLRAGGGVEQVGSPGTLLGVVPNIELHEVTLELQAGDTLVFYTDGVTEARTENGAMFGVDGLASAVSVCVGCDAAEVAERIESTLTNAQVERPRDDIAIVVVQISGDGGEIARLEPAATAAP